MQWNNFLYDTCCLITVDKILLDYPLMESYFQGIMAIEESFSRDRMKEETVNRIRPRVRLVALPPIGTLKTILETNKLPKSLAEVDRLIFAAAVYHSLRVVTADKELAGRLLKLNLDVTNCALILKQLVIDGVIVVPQCEAILASLVARKDHILPPGRPQTWASLEKYRFP